MKLYELHRGDKFLFKDDFLKREGYNLKSTVCTLIKHDGSISLIQCGHVDYSKEPIDFDMVSCMLEVDILKETEE